MYKGIFYQMEINLIVYGIETIIENSPLRYMMFFINSIQSILIWII